MVSCFLRCFLALPSPRHFRRLSEERSNEFLLEKELFGLTGKGRKIGISSPTNVANVDGNLREAFGLSKYASKESGSTWFLWRLLLRTLSEINRGGPASYLSDTLPSYLCQTSTNATDSGPRPSFDGPTSLEHTSSLGRACRACL
uniref:Uncharacterized protein n=1 Tax=Tanacetum cinerariifolium TaxID=118510 RepID=A0A6L2KYT9_TANCI|nr:hypothetical protein [Tanacetum cinerariifolium]